MPLQEKLIAGEQLVNTQYRLASLSGRKIIRLVLAKMTASVQHIVGFEMLADACRAGEQLGQSRRVDLDQGISLRARQRFARDHLLCH